MHAHDLINLLLTRLSYPMQLHKFTRVYTQGFPSVQFIWGCHEFVAVCPVAGGPIMVEHVVGEGIYKQTNESRYVEGLLNGAKRNDAGELTEYFGPAA